MVFNTGDKSPAYRPNELFSTLRKPPLGGGGFLVAPWDDQDESVWSKLSPEIL
jgi:hypothetical protein